MPDFAGLCALVTGGASGIGRTTAELLLSSGARVAVLDRDPCTVDGALALQVDLSDRSAVSNAVTEAVGDLGALDILLNNAGIGAQGTLEQNDDDEWAHVLDVNVVGLVRVTAAALPALRRSKQAAIVNTCSIAATAGVPNRALYSASKGAVLALTLAMAADYISEGIRVNAVNPGTVDTPWVQRLLMNADDDVAERTALEARQPHGRLVSAEEVAEAILYLASPKSGSTTGTWLAVDGGMSGLRLRPSR